MKRLLLFLVWVGLRVCASPLEDFVQQARQKHGDAGEAAARFLVEHMPSRDRATLSADYLLENLDLAFRARAEFPWAAAVPVDIFHNDVLPYAVFDETRDSWRAEFLEKAREVVKDARTASEATQLLNKNWFNLVNVHYNTGRKRPNQSARESMALGKATCTGLSIILVNACRAVGIPARAVGTPMWANERGNHTWVEIWDQDWQFTGADEYDANGLNRGWFVGDASQARADQPRYAIYATSWKRDGVSFPMVWARGSTEVAAVNVTARYARPAAAKPDRAYLGVRLFDQPGGTRVVAQICALTPAGEKLAEAQTKAGTADLNDLARLDLPPGAAGRLRFTVDGEVRELPFGPLAQGDPTIDAAWSRLVPVTPAVQAVEAWIAQPSTSRDPDAPALRAPLTRAEAERVRELLLADRITEANDRAGAELAAASLTVGDRTVRWMSRTFGEKPADGRSLWISLHGGGNTAPAVNDRQWTNQAGLYEPAEGIYLAPRAPTDTWNLWHEAHIDALFARLIEIHVVAAGVHPDKVYLLGYSAGGDGVWQVAPRMADRFAAAAMMAGHPNEASLLGLRNLPFAIFMGADDAAYRRNAVAAERGAELERLAAADPGGYPHRVRLYEGLGHWMQKRDAEALPWMAEHRRTPWPKRVVWQQDDVVHRRFYWIGVPEDAPLEERALIRADVNGQQIALTGPVPTGTILHLADELVNLDEPLTVTVNGRQVFTGRTERRALDMLRALDRRLDPTATPTSGLKLAWN